MYLYGSLEIDDYMKLREGANFHETLRKWHHMSILNIWKWICYNYFNDDGINIIELLKRFEHLLIIEIFEIN